MRAIIIFCAAYCVLCNCYKFPIASNPQYNIPIINFGGVNESIVYVRQNNTDNVLLKSLTKTLYEDQTVVLVRGSAFVKISKSRHNYNPNIIIVTERLLDPNELKLAALKIVFKSYWSPVYIVVTVQNGSETCHNGKFNETCLLNIEASLNYIWHRYKIVRVIVSFPLTCPYHFIIYGEKKKSTGSLYDRSIKIIKTKSKQQLKQAVLKNSRIQQLTNGYPLRASIFVRFPTSLTICNTTTDLYRSVNLSYSNGFCGLDGLVMNDFLTYYQYNWSIPKDESCHVYGFVDPLTNHISGSLGCIVKKKIDISFNSRFMVMYTVKNFYYLHYIATDTLAVVMKIPEVIPLWHYAFNGIGTKSAIIMNLLVLILGILTWASAWIVSDIEHKEPRKLYIYILNALTCTFFGFSIKRSNRFRVLRGTSLICSVILMSYYQGHVNNLFTTRKRYPELRTLKQLYKSGNSLYTSPSMQNLLITNVNGQDQEQVSYLKNMNIVNDSISYVLDHEKAATTGRGQDVQIQVLLEYKDSHGSPRLYVMEEPFHVYYLSYICATGFLFTEETMRFMMRLLEAGLPNKYYVWTRRAMRLGDTYPKTAAEPKPFEAIKLNHVRIAFLLLVTGYVLAALSFMVEVYLGRAKKKQYAVESAQSRNS